MTPAARPASVPVRAESGTETFVAPIMGSDITVEASLGKMYDTGREAGYKDGYSEATDKARASVTRAREQGILEGVKREKSRRKAKKARRELGLYHDEDFD